MTLKHICVIGVAATSLLSSCVDDKYDLSDIDTTVRVNVNDLVIPVNLDEIFMNDILKETDRIQIVDGEYAIIEDGTFKSTAVEVQKFNVASQPLNSTEIDLPFVPAAAGLTDAGYFEFRAPVERFNFTAGNIPTEITAIEKVGGRLAFRFTFTFDGLSAVASKAQIRDLELQLPKGLEITDAAGGSYDVETGELEFTSIDVIGEKCVIEIEADGADFEAIGAEFDYDTHTAEISGDFYAKEGKIVVANADLAQDASPVSIHFTIGYEIPDFPVTSFSGRMKYSITGVDISDVTLDDIPDVLTQPGTDIRLTNPRIFLRVDNPLQAYELTAQTGLTITSWHGSEATPYSIDEPYFTVGNGNANGVYTYCLSPKMPATIAAGYENPVHVPFTELSDVLSGDGLPSKLSISLDAPCIPDQPVKNLTLGTTLGSVDGHYSFVAPIELSAGSKIFYADVLDGWDSEDLEYLTITAMTITATIENSVPLALDITAYPIDKNGNRINGVEIEGAQLAAGSEPQEVKIYLTGEITGISGISFEAVATASASDQALSPDMTIKITKLRPAVTGYYEKEL